MKGLTKRQEAILRFISSYLGKHSYPPSYQDIADAFEIASKHGVVRHLDALERKGYIKKAGAKARSISIIDKRYQPNLPIEDFLMLPLIGRVAAGSAIWSEENFEKEVIIPRSMVKSSGKLFALRVQGQSMKDAGILDEDMVIVKSTNVANAGQIVVALIGDEVTVKRLIIRENQKYLKAENPSYPDIHPQSEWKIQGHVVGLIRDMVN